MAYTTINKHTDYFNTKLYTGNGGTQSITGVGFQPDFTWIKNRSATENHFLQDAVRGSTKRLNSNNTNAEATEADGVTAFTSDGFNLGYTTEVNGNGNNIVSWNWKGNGAGSANSDGDITSTVSANTTAGFSIVKWTANGSNTDTVGHGLGVEPKVVLYKRYDSTNNWYWAYKYVDGTLDYLHLNLDNAKADSDLGTYGFTTATTITNFGFGNTHSLIAYCFAEKTGYSKIGSYTGNGNVDGPFIYTGFKPAFVMIKRINSAKDWFIWDNKTSPNNVTNAYRRANTNGADGSYDWLDLVSNGIKIRNTSDGASGSGDTYIYMAFGQSLVGSNNILAVAR